MIAYRIQQAQHPTAWLLDPERQLSTSYRGSFDDEGVRNGVSACATIEDLAAYVAQGLLPVDNGSRLVAMECEWADDEDEDAEYGAILVIPTAIVSDELVPDSFFDLADAAFDALAA